MALSDLEIVFELHLRNKLGEDDKAYIVGVLDTPESCSSWTTFKSYLAQNTGMSEDINVSYLDSEEDEVPICCENDYQCALDYFRHKARRGQRIVLKVYKRGLKSSGSPSPQGNAKLNSVRRLHLKKKSSGHYCVEETTESEEDAEEPPVWFTNYMKKFKGEISTTIVNTMLTLLENGVVKHPQDKCCVKKKKTTNEESEMPELVCDDKLIRKINRLQVREKKIERKYESKLVKLENKAKRIVEKKLHSGNGHDKCQTYKRFAEKCKQGAIPKHVLSYVCQPYTASAPVEGTVKPSSEERRAKKDSSSEKQVQYENLLTTDVPSVDAATILIPDKTVVVKESSSEIVQKPTPTVSEGQHSPADMDAVSVDSKIIPVHILKGQIVTKRWQVLNNGLYPWTEETELRYSWGSSALVPLQLSVKCPKLKPGEVGCIEAIMQAQDLSGCFEAYWHFYHKGIRFGDWLYCSYVTDVDYCSHIIANGTGTPCLTSVSTMEEMKKIEIETNKIQAQIDSIESKPVCESSEKPLNNNSLKKDAIEESTVAEKEMKTNQLDSPKNSVTVKNGFETDLNNFSEPKEKLVVSPAVSETKNSDSDNISIISESSVESNEDFVIVPCSQYQSDSNSETSLKAFCRELCEARDNELNDILDYPDPKDISDAQEYIRSAWSAIGASTSEPQPTESVTYLHDEFLYKLRTMKSHLFLEPLQKPIEYNLIFDPIKDVIKSERIKHQIEDLAYPRELTLPAVCFNDDKTLIYFKDVLRPEIGNEDILRQELYASIHIKDQLRTPISYSNIFREKPTIVTCDKLKQLLMKDINSSLGIASEWNYSTDSDTDCKRKLESPIHETRNDKFVRAACSSPNEDCNKLRDQLKAKKRRSKDCKTSPKVVSELTSARNSAAGIESGKQSQESVLLKCEEQSTQTTEPPNYFETSEASRKFVFTSQGFGFEASDLSPFANKDETLPKSSSSRYSYVFTQPNGNPIPTSENGSQTDEILRRTPPTTEFVEDASQPVHILPESLMTGAVNAASTAFNTARTVFDMFRGNEEEMNSRGFQVPVEQPTNNNRNSRRSGSCSPTHMSTVQCLDILHDMGFTNKEVNLKYLHKYNNDLNTVISKLL